MTSSRVWALIAWAAVFASAPASAQDALDVAPKPPPQSPQSGAITPPAPQAAPAVSADPNQLLLPALKGLRLVDDVSHVVRTGMGGEGIVIEALPVLENPDLRAQLQVFIGKPLTAGDLPRISQVIVSWYRTHNRPVVDVAFPEQNISPGMVQAVVSEYRTGKLKFEGNLWFSSDVLADEMKLKSGDPIDLDVLKSDISRLNRNPFRTVNAVMERSVTPGDVDIALKTDDRFPVRAYAGFDNSGLFITGRDRYNVGFNWGNVFGLDHQFSYQFTTSPDLWRTRNRGPGLSNDPRFMAHSATYAAPLPWGDTLNIFGSYVQQVPDLGPDFGQVGHNLQLGLRYQKELPSTGSLTQLVQIGFDYKRSDNNLAFGGAQVFASATNVEQFLLIYGATLTDSLGQTALTNSLAISPGRLSGGNTSPAFQASGVVGASAGYAYDTLSISRLTLLPWDMTWLVRATGQFASTELLPSEQLGAGGVDSVRGYDARAVNGSQGVVGSMELRSPTWKPLQSLTGWDDQGQLLAFYDYGHVAYKNAQSGLPKNAEIQSIGVGARYGIGRYFDARFDYGWQLEKAPGAAQLGNLAMVSVTLGY